MTVDRAKVVSGIKLALHRGLGHAVNIRMFERDAVALMEYAWMNFRTLPEFAEFTHLDVDFLDMAAADLESHDIAGWPILKKQLGTIRDRLKELPTYIQPTPP